MEEHAIGLFLHVVGGIGMCIALGIEWAGLWQLRNAHLPEQARTTMGIFKGAARLGLISMLVTLLVAFYMIWIEWGFVAWITVSLVSIFLVVVLFVAVTKPRIAAMGHMLATEKGALSDLFHRQAVQPLLWISIQSRATLLLGITFLMVGKPEPAISLLTLGVSIVLGLILAIPFFSRERVQEKMAG